MCACNSHPSQLVSACIKKAHCLINCASLRIGTEAPEQHFGGGPLTPDHLRCMLAKDGKLPTAHRAMAWASFLGTAGNAAAFQVKQQPLVRTSARGPHLLAACGNTLSRLYVTQALTGRRTHPAYADLQSSCSMRDTRLLRCLQCTLSALAWQQPELAGSFLLPAAVFPFVEQFGDNPLACFEARRQRSLTCHGRIRMQVSPSYQ